MNQDSMSFKLSYKSISRSDFKDYRIICCSSTLFHKLRPPTIFNHLPRGDQSSSAAVVTGLQGIEEVFK